MTEDTILLLLSVIVALLSSLASRDFFFLLRHTFHSQASVIFYVVLWIILKLMIVGIVQIMIINLDG